jgi:hypothetical protein
MALYISCEFFGSKPFLCDTTTKKCFEPHFYPVFRLNDDLDQTAFQPSHPNDDVISTLLTYVIVESCGTGQQIQYFTQILRRVDFGWEAQSRE